MDADGWIKACREDDLEEGVPRVVQVGESAAYLVRLGGQVRAVSNVCPHYECGLDEGALIGNEIVCKCHDARFDARTGRMLSPPSLKDLPTFPVRLEDGEIWLGNAEKAGPPQIEGNDPRVFVIAGGGAAGNAAAETLRSEGFAGRVILLTAEDDPPYDRPNLSKEFLAGTAKAEWMPLRSRKFYESRRIEVRTGTAVASLDPAKKTIMTSGGETIPFDKLLLATGASPVAPNIPGADTPGCFLLRSFADGRAIAAAAEGAASVALVGAGFIGLELASSFRERGLRVTVVAPEAVPLGGVLGDRIGTFLKERHEAAGVNFRLGSTVARIAGPAGAKLIVLTGGAEFTADLVVLALGVKPAVAYLQGTALVKDGAIPVNGRLETAVPDILAAGDLALVPSARGGAPYRSEHWVVAERQGMHAARSMLGSTADYDEVPFFWTRQHKLGLHYVGFAREWDELAVRGDVEAGKFLAGYYSKGKLAAAASLGMSTALIAVEYLMRRDAAPSADQLADPSVDLLALARARSA